MKKSLLRIGIFFGVLIAINLLASFVFYRWDLGWKKSNICDYKVFHLYDGRFSSDAGSDDLLNVSHSRCDWKNVSVDFGFL